MKSSLLKHVVATKIYMNTIYKLHLLAAYQNNAVLSSRYQLNKVKWMV